MNLIEQLGGYERAKHEFEMIKEMKPIYPGEIETNDRLLLEYRRQNNIFEKGDQVCYIGEIQKNPFWDLNSIFTIKEIWDGEIDLITSDDDLGCFPVRPHQIGHATDAEIEAGKRLEVNDGST